MNYREFTERVYNYKHGLTNSAESQNIQHSSDESIEHSSKGDSWDQHKYIRKEYLGNGNWKYIYEDGTSHVSTGANEIEADAREDADYIKRTTPNVSQAQQGREGAANQSINNAKYGPGLKQAQQGREFAAEKSIYNAKNPDVNEAQKARDLDALKSQRNAAYGPGLKAAQKGREEAINDSMPKNEETSSEVIDTNTEDPLRKSVNNTKAYDLLMEYTKGLKEVIDILKASGFTEEEIDNTISNFEKKVVGYDAAYDQMKNFNSETDQIQFFDGAEEGIKNLVDNVLPLIRMEAAAMINKKNGKTSASEPVSNIRNPYDPYLRSLGYDPMNITGAEIRKAFPSSYNPYFKDEEHYALQDDQTFKLISNEPEVKTEPEPEQSSVDPNTWYNYTTGEFVTGTTEDTDDALYKSMRESIYQSTLDVLKKNKGYTDLYSEEELKRLARKNTNSFVENFKLSSNK